MLFRLSARLFQALLQERARGGGCPPAPRGARPPGQKLPQMFTGLVLGSPGVGVYRDAGALFICALFIYPLSKYLLSDLTVARSCARHTGRHGERGTQASSSHGRETLGMT